jgi:nicotinamidase-related amidase
MLLDAGKSFLLTIDMQDRLLPAMNQAPYILKRASIVIEAAHTLGLPMLASEQYPRGLGPTVPDIKSALGDALIYEKLAFSCWRDKALKAKLIELHEGGRPQAIICGIEAHVCLLQTACDLAQAGFAVFAVADAMSSRREESVLLAHARMRQNGVELINTEMAVFELLGKAGTPEFKGLSALIR